MFKATVYKLLTNSRQDVTCPYSMIDCMPVGSPSPGYYVQLEWELSSTHTVLLLVACLLDSHRVVSVHPHQASACVHAGRLSVLDVV